MNRSLIELVVVLVAIGATSLSGGRIGDGEAKRAGQGMAAAGITTGAILGAYKVFKDSK
jgi:hypothetical protein